MADVKYIKNNYTAHDSLRTQQLLSILNGGPPRTPESLEGSKQTYHLCLANFSQCSNYQNTLDCIAATNLFLDSVKQLKIGKRSSM